MSDKQERLLKAQKYLYEVMGIDMDMLSDEFSHPKEDDYEEILHFLKNENDISTILLGCYDLKKICLTCALYNKCERFNPDTIGKEKYNNFINKLISILEGVEK